MKSMTILAINRKSDLYTSTADHHDTTSDPVSARRRPRTPGIETVTVRRPQSPFVQQSLNSDGTFKSLLSRFTRQATNTSGAPSTKAITTSNAPFSDIPTVALRRIDCILLENTGPSPSLIALILDAIVGCFRTRSHVIDTSSTPDYHRFPLSASSDGSSFDSEPSSDNDCDSDTEAPECDRPLVKQQLVSEHQRFSQAQRSAYESVVYRSTLQPLPTARDVFFTRLKGDVPQLGNRFQSPSPAAPRWSPLSSDPSFTGHSIRPQEATGLRSALKGSRSQHEHHAPNTVRNTKVVFQTLVQVKSISKWIDQSLHYQGHTLEEPSDFDREALRHTVFYLERERRSGSL
jgi:hypothetical protein